MHGTEAASSDFLLDCVLVDAVVRRIITIAADIVRASVQSLLHLSHTRWFSSMVSDRALICRSRHVLDRVGSRIWHGGREFEFDAMARVETDGGLIRRRRTVLMLMCTVMSSMSLLLLR